MGIIGGESDRHMHEVMRIAESIKGAIRQPRLRKAGGKESPSRQGTPDRLEQMLQYDPFDSLVRVGYQLPHAEERAERVLRYKAPAVGVGVTACYSAVVGQSLDDLTPVDRGLFRTLGRLHHLPEAPHHRGGEDGEHDPKCLGLSSPVEREISHGARSSPPKHGNHGLVQLEQELAALHRVRAERVSNRAHGKETAPGKGDDSSRWVVLVAAVRYEVHTGQEVAPYVARLVVELTDRAHAVEAAAVGPESRRDGLVINSSVNCLKLSSIQKLWLDLAPPSTKPPSPRSERNNRPFVVVHSSCHGGHIHDDGSRLHSCCFVASNRVSSMVLFSRLSKSHNME